MDSLTIERLSYNPIKPDLPRIKKINDLSGVIKEIVYERTNGEGSPLFGFGVGQDSKHPTKNIVQFSQGGTSLPDRDYYLKDDARTKKIQAAYKQYIINLFTLTGSSEADAQENAETIFGIESKLAKPQMSRVAMRDPNKTYNRFAVTDFDKTTPHLNWSQLMPQMSVTGQDTVLVAEPDFFATADALLAITPVADWKVYLQWNILKGSATALSSPFVKANFDFSSVLSGQFGVVLVGPPPAPVLVEPAPPVLCTGVQGYSDQK